MEAKEILGRIKELFNDLVAPAPITAPVAPVTLGQDYELAGGGTVQIDKLEEGGIVMIDGNAALPGELELADGTKLTVGDNGVITAIAMGTPAAPAEPPVFDAQGKFAELETLTTGKFADFEAKFAAQETQLAEMNVALKKANTVIEQLLKLSELLVDQPAAQPDPSVKTSNTFKEDKKIRKVDILFN